MIRVNLPKRPFRRKGLYTGAFSDLELDPNGADIAQQFCLPGKVTDELIVQVVMPAARSLAMGWANHAQALGWVATRCNDLNELVFCAYNLRALAAQYAAKAKATAEVVQQ